MTHWVADKDDFEDWEIAASAVSNVINTHLSHDVF